MDAQQIKAFIDVMAASDLAEAEFSQDGWTLRLVRRGGIVEATQGVEPATPATPATIVAADRTALPPHTAAATPASNDLKAPLFGIVHLQRSPGEPPFVRVGQAVEAGQTVCVIEAMKVFNEVLAERDGSVAAVLVESGQEVEAGQPLLRFA